MKEKDYPALHMLFPFLPGSIDFVSGLTEVVHFGEAPTMYSDVVCLPHQRSDGERNSPCSSLFSKGIRQMKAFMEQMFQWHPETGLYTMSFNLIHHLLKALHSFGTWKP